MERYRSGRNGGASKASCRVTGTGVRIPPSPPTSVARVSIHRELRRHGFADADEIAPKRVARRRTNPSLSAILLRSRTIHRELRRHGFADADEIAPKRVSATADESSLSANLRRS